MTRKEKCNTPVRISLARQTSEHHRVHAFVVRGFRNHFNTEPQASEFFLGAYCNDRLVGAIGVDFCENTAVLPFEQLYRGAALKALQERRTESTQFSKWLTTVASISDALMLAAARFALAKGKKCCWVVAKQPAIQALNRLGLSVTDVPAELCRASIPENDRLYFLTQPPPALYVMDLRQIEEVLSKKIDGLIDQGKVILNMEASNGRGRISSHTKKSISTAIEKTSAAYENVSVAYEKHVLPFHDAVTHPRIISLIEVLAGSLEGKEILDIGCGSGCLMQRLYDSGSKCTGIDITPAFVRMAQSRGLDVKLASMHALPFPDEAFHIVVSTFALNYLPQTGQHLALEEAFRVLRPGGVLVLALMHPSLMRTKHYTESPPYVIPATNTYFEPIRKLSITQLEEEFTLYLLDWWEIVELVISCGFTLKAMPDAEVPANLNDIAGKVTDKSHIALIKSFCRNPYALFVVAVK